MVSVASDVMFMWWWLGVAFLTNLRIQIWGARGCQELFIFLYILLLFAVVEQSWAIMCCILQVLWHSAVFHLCFLHWIWHTGSFFAAIYCQSEPCKSDLVVFYNSLACLVHSLGPRDHRPSRIQIASQRHVRSCNGYSVCSRGGHNRSQWEL